ncbi:MAG: RagB/SusD family nutrient uptake outer membrane protein, partial [Sphingobacteriales bacterium]|nr:RagB/SusD family nutrient uptake outer membrane protein [Sphingobacteriales bacterium]
MSGIFKFLFGLTFLVFFSECKKLVQVSEPINTLTAEKTFRTEANATSALIEVYNDLISGGGYGLSTFGLNYGNGATTCYLGLSADEMNFYNGGDAISMQFQNNNLQSDNMYVKNLFWLSPYFDIYLSNAVIEGVGASSLPQRVKDQLSGEAKFLRAFCNFYLVNLFDSVPLVTTTAWAHTSTLPRASTSEIYDQIKSDLQDAQNILKEDYSVSNGERVRVNKWAATAFLARVSLYLGDWKN